MRRSDITAPWRADLILSSEIDIPAQRSALYRSTAKGEYVRVRRGVFIPAPRWRALGPEERHRERVRATALAEPGVVIAGLSAAMLWNLPLVVAPPALPQVVVARTSGGRSSLFVQRLGIGIPNGVVEIDGMRVAPLAWTVAQIAAACDAEISVPIIDAALAGRAFADARVEQDVLMDVPIAIGTRRRDFALGFADSRSGSPGESLSRVAIHRAGLPAPDLQVEFHDDRGQIGFVDFHWPDRRIVGEFDGEGKYRRDLSGRDRSPADIVIAEKWREDRLRAVGQRVVRWGWSTARAKDDLRGRLIRAGLRPR
jgi:hypothetical protein